MKLLSILILTCGLLLGAFCSDKAESLTKEQIENLADKIMENTPEYIHFGKAHEVIKWIVLRDLDSVR